MARLVFNSPAVVCVCVCLQGKRNLQCIQALFSLLPLFSPQHQSCRITDTHHLTLAFKTNGTPAVQQVLQALLKNGAKTSSAIQQHANATVPTRTHVMSLLLCNISVSITVGKILRTVFVLIKDMTLLKMMTADRIKRTRHTRRWQLYQQMNAVFLINNICLINNDQLDLDLTGDEGGVSHSYTHGTQSL